MAPANFNPAILTICFIKDKSPQKKRIPPHHRRCVLYTPSLAHRALGHPLRALHSVTEICSGVSSCARHLTHSGSPERRPADKPKKDHREQIMRLVKIGAMTMLLAPCAAFAAAAFDGTWKFSVEHIQPSQKPFVLQLNNGEYTCVSCAVPTAQKADGTEHPLMGNPNADSGTVTVADAHNVTLILKLHGKVVDTFKYVITADGKSMTVEEINEYGAAPNTFKQQLTRMTDAPAGAHALSGSWGAAKLLSADGPGVMVTYGMTDDGFTMSSNGQSYEAKFDGSTYPIKGDPTKTVVNLKKVSDREVIETDSQNGKPVETYDMKVSADGKSLHIVDTVLHDHRVSKYVMAKTH
jgi:hypothetical protein